ncbi:MAG: Hsp20/alpha crystallin family protein [Candidatus Promineifilaceae bacterium]|nr:Hsp20/alpha crystallin family protein [Candidatus Promineifilaceae bacterium]
MSEPTMEIEKREAELPAGTERTRMTETFIPSVDIYETEDTVFLLADMPGVDDESIDITLEKNVLTIRGEVEAQSPDEHEPAYSEYRVGDYERTFTLSDEVDRDRIEATMKNGVLRLRLPKAEEAKTRKILVKAED